MTTPPGWPAAVRPIGSPGWQRSAVSWLLDLCPPDYRGYPVLARHPLALAHVAAHHVAAAERGCRAAVAGARAELADDLPPPALDELLAVLDTELGRLLAAQRGIAVVEAALRGQRYIPRL